MTASPAAISARTDQLDIEVTYRRHRAERQADLDARELGHAWFSRVRLLIAAAGGTILLTLGLDGLVWLLVPIAAFAAVAVAHSQLLNARDRAASAVAFYDRGLARMAGDWIGRGRDGVEYRPKDHLYADDLDLFGRGSLFELLATTRTRAGEEALARWLLESPSRRVALDRQQAVCELAGRLDLREKVAVIGDALRSTVGVDTTLLRRWSASPVRLEGRTSRLLLAVLSALSVGTLLYWLRTGTLGGLALTLLLVQLAVGAWYKSRALSVIAAVEEPSHDLDLLAVLLRTLERERFESPHLERLRTAIGTDAQPASTEIARLARAVALLASRRNVLFAPISGLLLWATQWAFAIEAWRGRVGRHVPEWLDAVGELEALLALGGYAAEHPESTFPVLLESGPALVATALAHPTLPPTAIANDIALGLDAPHLIVVSGSNMSGKSTWLRTIGVNVVLAGLGAPVRARRMELSALALGTAISVHDSLGDGRSRFFAEITRLKRLVDLASSHRGATLFLLDEMLSGTNSHDRRIGAEAVLATLVGRGAIGLVTTHDLALGDITGRLPALAVNMHFEDQFAEGTLAFDYTLRNGVVRTSNALALMRSIGLEV